MEAFSPQDVLNFRYRGVAYASIIISLWLFAVICGLWLVDVNQTQPVVFVLLFLLITFLYTGLFITAHDAMHGVVDPQSPKRNNFIGALAIVLYALFSYQKVLEEHRKHHAHPATSDDPDYHDGEHESFFAWYLRFLFHYLSIPQLVGMAVIFNVLHHFAGVPLINLVCFWVTPALTSTLQLFYFGTYLPHREPKGGYKNRHCAESSNYSELCSFLSCYHFGYHYEHHEFPYVPWWKLPEVRRSGGA